MKVDYGVRALVDLALHAEKQPTQAAEIAARQQIPEPYLEQLMSILHKAGYVYSRRGPQGGHTLAKQPTEISLGMIINSLEGNPVPLDCINTPGECGVYTVCAQREVWESVDKAINQVLDATSISDLASRQRERTALAQN
jgi:Rrf2 family protein